MLTRISRACEVLNRPNIEFTDPTTAKAKMSQTVKQQADVPKNKSDEEILYVPMEMIEHPLGFVVDAGSSVTKVVYRSKKDYSAGKPLRTNPDHGILRLRYFDMKDVTNIIDFLRDNCDIIIEDGKEWWITGVTTQHFKKNLDSSLKIETKLFSENMALGTYFKHIDQMNTGCFEVDLEAVKYAKENGNNYFKMFKDLQELGETTLYSEFQEPNDATKESSGAKCPFNVMDTSAMKLLSGNAEDWAKEYLEYSGKMEYPILLVHMGSAIPIGLITEDKQFKMVDFLSSMGKMLCGLSEELTKESNFDKFIQMAEHGNLDNVDLLTDDVRSEEHGENDWYKPMPTHVTAFELGKLSSNNISGKGTYNKDDLAIGLLSAMLKVMVKVTFLNAKLHNVKTILFSGSLPKYKVVRHHLLRNLLLESVLNNLKGNDLIKIFFLKNPGFICALGVWWKNLEKGEGKKMADDVRK